MIESELFDWAKIEGFDQPVSQPRDYVAILDESLRDGLQGLQVDQHPPLEEKKTYIEKSSQYADKIDLGYPGSEAEQKIEIINLLKYLREQKLPIIPIVTGRGADKRDIEPIIDIYNALDGANFEAYIFLDGSTERAVLQGWDRQEKIAALKENILLLRQHDISVGFVAERSTATPTEELKEVLQEAIDCGAEIIVLTDTQGKANSKAIRKLCRWALHTFSTNNELSFEAHFHNSRALAVSNTLAAADEGLDRVDTTFGGIGEGAGNADYIQTLINLNMEGLRHDKNLRGLHDFKLAASEIFRYSIPPNTPFYGGEAFGSGSGIHASAILREVETSQQNQIYFCIDPAIIGERIVIKVGPSGGDSSVIYVLQEAGIKPTPDMVDAILKVAKKGRGYISNSTIFEIARKHIKAY